MEARYSDPKTIVVKFRRGLDTQIQNAIATMPSGCPSDMVPMDWYTAARTIDQNRATNEAFRSSYQTPSVAPTPSHPATFNTVQYQALERSTNHQHAPTPINPVPMDIDASQKTQLLPFSCYRCRKAGHKAPDCPTQFDIQELSIDDLQTYLEDHLAELDAKHPEPTAEVEAGFFLSQRVNSMPSLSYHNCFSVLPICSVNEDTVEPSIDVQNSISENPIVVPMEITQNRCPKWERRLPTKLVIASVEDGSTSLKLKVELETTDTGEVKSVNSFVDSRATGEFIDRHYAKSNWLYTRKLSEPILVYNVDGTLNKAGSITEVVDLILRY